ncbi:MAG: diaminopimelate epimerase [Bacillota bacterium]|nr:diaminopimelate epimerase [Bacillota bacterium]
MRFAKMHGLGNDFVVVNGFKEKLPEDLGGFATEICHRQLGVGADGLIILSPADGVAAAKFSIYNDDGSQAEMCGNGLRCAAVFARREGIVDSDEFVFETLAGLVQPSIIDMEHSVIRVDMGAPRLLPEQIPASFTGSRVVGAPLLVYARVYDVTLVSMGNPHCVTFVEDVEHFPVEKIGPQIETHSSFPAKTNVEFIELVDDQTLKMRVWERGCGETLACGSGACAATVAAILNGYTKNKVEVLLRYGSLSIEWADNGHIYMTGPAALVAEGEYLL